MPSPLERIDSVKWIGKDMAVNIHRICGGDDIDCVLKYLGACKSQEELRTIIRDCCANSRAGQRLENGYVVPNINERAVMALLSLLIERSHHLQHIKAAKIQSMISKMGERRSAGL
jgi:hypothetical protein